MMAHAPGTGPFPLPALPLPHQPQSRSRRLWQRYRRAVHATQLANQVIESINTLSVSFARFRNTSSSHQSSAVTVTALSSRLLAHIYCCASRFARRQGNSSSGPLSDDSFVSFFSYSFPSFDPQYLFESLGVPPISYLSQPSVAVPLVAERVALPSKSVFVPLLELLPAGMAELFSGPDKLLAPVDEQKRPPKASRFCEYPEWVALVKRLMALGMVSFTQRPKVVNGSFGTPKKDGAIRWIVDARPANCLFVRPNKVQLPTPDLLARLSAPPGRPLFVAKIDLDNFYHRLLLPDWMPPFFALPAVRAGDVGAPGFPADATVYPCCRTLPMGFSHSVDLAQAAHENFLTTKTSLAPADRITPHNDFRVDRIRHQVYIDDVNILGHDKERVRRAQDEYIEAVRARGFPVKESKIVRPSCDGVECVGLEVHGRDLTVGLAPAKLAKLRRDTLAVLAVGLCTGDDMARLVGRWTWAILARRPALSVLNACYRFIETAGKRRFTIWRTVRDELTLLVGLSPLLHADMSASWLPRALATDASMLAQGVSAAWVEAAEAEALAQRQSRRVDEDDFTVDEFAARQQWTHIVASPWRFREHINVLELRALCTGVRWILSSPQSVGGRLLCLCDSQVVVGAVAKGRSSSQPLLRRLRFLSSLVLSSGLQLSIHWVRTESNPADEPSRLFSGHDDQL